MKIILSIQWQIQINVMVARKEFKGLDAIKRVPIFEDYTKITMEK